MRSLPFSFAPPARTAIDYRTMKPLILLLTLLCLTPATFSQDAKPKKSKLIVAYDKFQDRTNISTQPRKPKATLGILVSGYFNHETETLREAITHVGLIFDSYSSDWQFLKQENRPLFVIADGERFEFNNPVRDSRVNRGYGPYSRTTVTERLIFSFERKQLEKLLSAQTLQMRLGLHGNPFSLGNETLADLRELISRMSPQP